MINKQNKKIEKKTHELLVEACNMIYAKTKNKEIYDAVLQIINTFDIKFLNITKTKYEISNNKEKFVIEFIPNMINTNQIIINSFRKGFSSTKKITFLNNEVVLREEILIDNKTSKNHSISVKEFKNNLLKRKELTNVNIVNNQKQVTIREAFISKGNILAREAIGIHGKKFKLNYYNLNKDLRVTFSDDRRVVSDTLLDSFLFMYLEDYRCTEGEFDFAYNLLKNKENAKILTRKNKIK